MRSRTFPIPGVIKVHRSSKQDTHAHEMPQTVAVCGGEPLPELHLQHQPCSQKYCEEGTTPCDVGETLPEEVSSSAPPCTMNEESPANADDMTMSGYNKVMPPQDRSRSSTHIAKFERLLAEKTVDLEALRRVAWSGVPPHLRPTAWRLLLGYLPPSKDRRDTVLKRKRREYLGMVPEFYGEGREQSEEELAMRRQVQLDAPRTAPNESFFQQDAIQSSLIRILYMFGIRHPASGYVQGINDLVTPFMAVFLSEHYSGSMDSWDVTGLDNQTLMDVEADCYWCLCKMLDNIQDHYTYAQPGIQRKVFKLKELVRRINEPLARHLEQEGVEFMLFAHRWVNCLLVREFPLVSGVRLWDTFLAEVEDFGDFFVYVCASFLNSWAVKLLSLDFQELMMFLQKMPTSDWGEKEVETMLATAFLWQTSFGNAKSHLSG